MQEVGAEYGTTTGRRRRCGWLDLVVLKYSHSINGYDTLNLTKLDVLDGLKEIEVAVAYELNGKEISGFPGTSQQASKPFRGRRRERDEVRTADTFPFLYFRPCCFFLRSQPISTSSPR